MLCNGEEYSVAPYNTVKYSTVEYNTAQYRSVQYCTVHHNTKEYSTEQQANWECYKVRVGMSPECHSVMIRLLPNTLETIPFGESLEI